MPSVAIVTREVVIVTTKVRTMYNISKFRSSNSGHHNNKKITREVIETLILVEKEKEKKKKEGSKGISSASCLLPTWMHLFRLLTFSALEQIQVASLIA